MLVRMLRNTGGPHGLACWAGEVYDLPTPTARQFIAEGRAVEADGPLPPLEVHDRQMAPSKRREKK